MGLDSDRRFQAPRSWEESLLLGFQPGNLVNSFRVTCSYTACKDVVISFPLYRSYHRFRAPGQRRSNQGTHPATKARQPPATPSSASIVLGRTRVFEELRSKAISHPCVLANKLREI